MAIAAGVDDFIWLCWILSAGTLPKWTEFLRGEILALDDWNQRRFARLDTETNFPSACSECIHRPRYDHFCLAPVALPGHLGWIIRTILLFVSFRIFITLWLLLTFCISVIREQDICAMIRCQKFGMCAILCTSTILYTSVITFVLYFWHFKLFRFALNLGNKTKYFNCDSIYMPVIISNNIGWRSDIHPIRPDIHSFSFQLASYLCL
jgi:hypothetical protein